MVKTLAKRLIKEVNNIKRDNLTWRSYVISGCTITAWEKEKKYTAEKVLDVYNTYERWLLNGQKDNFQEAREEEYDEGHPKEWLDDVIFTLIMEGEKKEEGSKEKELAKKLRREFHYRGF